MEQKAINTLKMVSNVVAGMEQEKAVWEGEPEIVKKNIEIKSVYESIGGKNLIILSTDKSGFTTAKDILFENITNATYKLLRQMSAYAKIKNDHVLLPLVDLSMSALTRGPQKEVVDRCAAIVEKAIQLLPQFSIVKVKAETLEIIKNQIKDFNNTLTERSTVSTNLSVSGEEIAQGIVTLKISLDILDDLVEGIIEDEGFIARYKSWRKIPDFGKGKTLKNPEKPIEP